MSEMTPAEGAHVLRDLKTEYIPFSASSLAIEAGAEALEQAPGLQERTRILLDALQQTRDRVHSLEVEARDLEHRRHAIEDRHADLQVHCAQLADLIRSIEWYGTRCNVDITGCEDEDVCPVCDCSVVEGHKPNCRLATMLQGDGTTQGHAILQEVQRLREFERACRAAVEIEYDVKALLAVHAALAALDRAAPPDDGR
jgi:DNA repair exonuclease SbcCD ATPase subunit